MKEVDEVLDALEECISELRRPVLVCGDLIEHVAAIIVTLPDQIKTESVSTG